MQCRALALGACLKLWGAGLCYWGGARALGACLRGWDRAMLSGVGLCCWVGLFWVRGYALGGGAIHLETGLCVSGRDYGL